MNEDQGMSYEQIEKLQDLFKKKDEEIETWKKIALEKALLADEYKKKYEDVVEECYHRGIERDLNS